MDEYTVSLPTVKAVAFSANPCAAGSQVTITVTVAEVTRTLTPERIYSGEIYSNEV